MNAPAHGVRPKAVSKAASEPVRRAASPSPAPPAAAATPRYLRSSLKIGGVNDPEEREAEHAAAVIAGGGCYQVHDPGGSMHLRAASPPATETHARASPAQGAAQPPIRAAAAPPLLDPGASGRVRRAVAEPILDPGASGRVRRAAGPPLPGVGSDVAKQIERARSTATRPLPPAVQARLERGFGERMDNVGLHTGPIGRAAARAIGARAYTEGERITLGAGESEHDVRLMAHEATHVVQNRRAAGVFRALPADSAARRAPQAELRKAELHQPEIHKSELPKSELRKSELRKSEALQAQPIRRFGLDTILDKFADWANVIPGYRLFTIVLGMNPINQAPVERSGANILRGAVELIPFGGLIVKALDTYGIFEKAGAWVEEQIKTLGMVGSSIYQALLDFLDSLGLSDIIHPGDVWDRAKRIFTDPIDRLIDFFKAVGTGIIELIKDAILKPLAALASKTRAWDLLCAVLGRNPITNEPVERSADTLVGGMMKLAGQEDVWESIQKAHALQRVWSWFQKAIGDLLGFVREVPGLFIAALKSFVIQDLLDLPGALMRVAGMFADFVGKFIKWGLDAAWTLLEIVFDVVSPAALGYIKKTGAALKKILKNPLPFVGNLVKAAKLGLSNFADHIGTHLKNGLIEWLTGALTGVYLPKALSLAEIGKFALSVLGVTWLQIRGKIVKALGPTGEKIMSGLEKAADFIIKLVNGGPAAAWEMVKEKLDDLKDSVIDGIKGFVESTIVKVAIPKLVAMFIPGAGFISAIISIYGTIKAFMEQLARIAAAVAAFIDSIVAIAEGQIGGAAAKVEGALAGVIPVAIGLLAGFLGLGGISDKVIGVVKKVQTVVDKAVDTAIAWIIGKAKALFAKLFGGKDGDKKDGKIAETSAKSFSLPEESHTVTATADGDNLKVVIASDREGDMLTMLSDAAAEVSSDQSRKPEEKADILATLSGVREMVKTMGNEYHSLSKQAQGGDYKSWSEVRLTQITQLLSHLGGEGIKAFRDFKGKPLDKRYLPTDYDVRNKLYLKGSGWSGNRASVIATGKAEVERDVRAFVDNKTSNPSKAEEAWDRLVKGLRLPKGATRNSLTLDLVRSTQYDVDHFETLSIHWVSGGNNTGDGARWALSSVEKIRYITQLDNLDRERAKKYDRFVGPDFVSVNAQGGAPNAKEIDGQPFLDATGKPI